MGLAFLAAILCAFLKLKLEGIVVGVGLYFSSYLLTRYAIKIENSGQYDVYLIGAGTYATIWLTFWFIFNTFLSV